MEVIYLLKRGLTRSNGQMPVAVTVVEYDTARSCVHDHPVGRRYRALFGESINWHPEGLDNWLAQQSAAVAATAQ